MRSLWSAAGSTISLTMHKKQPAGLLSKPAVAFCAVRGYNILNIVVIGAGIAGTRKRGVPPYAGK